MITGSEMSIKSSRIARPVSLVVLDGKLPVTSPLHACKRAKQGNIVIKLEHFSNSARSHWLLQGQNGKTPSQYVKPAQSAGKRVSESRLVLDLLLIG